MPAILVANTRSHNRNTEESRKILSPLGRCPLAADMHNMHRQPPNDVRRSATGPRPLANAATLSTSRFGPPPTSHGHSYEPHGRPGKENLKATAAGEVACLSCHNDKRGPYVFAHGGATVGDCTNCHEAHGSSNARQLKRASVAQLCLECHSPTATHTLGSQPPAFHNLTQSRYQNCTTCHVAIHGSHRSPQLLK